MRDDTKIIEKKWHPIPKHNGLEICHEHKRNGTVIFTAWHGEHQANDRQLQFDRYDVAYNNAPSSDDLDWLTGGAARQ
jgi:hypothetical protein